MKGYLQRLATSANSGGRIHPVLRPIFSAATPEIGRDPSDLEEASIRTAPEPHRQPDVDTASQPVAVRAPELNRPPLLQSQPNAVTPTQSDLPRDNSSKSRSADRDAASISTGSAQRQWAHSREPLAGEQETARAQARQGSFARPFVPLLAPTGEPDDPALTRIDRPPPAVAPGLTRTDMASLVQNARRVASEPDEVQIHIGRIEVTAVQPPPARLAIAKQQRSAMSLEDYLKQRNGRAS